MFHDESLDSIQLLRAETPIPLESHGIKPKFSLVALMAHVNVHGLRTVNCVEEEAIRSDPKDGRHPSRWARRVGYHMAGWDSASTDASRTHLREGWAGPVRLRNARTP